VSKNRQGENMSEKIREYYAHDLRIETIENKVAVIIKQDDCSVTITGYQVGGLIKALEAYREEFNEALK
jgi:hypothetical protein